MASSFKTYAVSFLLLLGISLSHSLSAENLPDLTLQTKQGALKLSDLRGQAIYLDFWASWCVPCRKSFPWMNEMQQRYGKHGLKVIAVNLDKDPELAAKFLKDYPANFTVAYDAQGTSAEKMKVQAMPSSYLIDRNGVLVQKHMGFKENDTASLEADIKALLKRK